MIGAVIGSVIGGAIGAAIWAAVGYFTGYEVGYVAWGVGVLAGLGAAVGANVIGSGPSTGTGILAAVVALASVAAGKLAVIEIAYLNDPDLASAAQIGAFNDEILTCYVALQVADYWDEEGIPIHWPQIPDDQWFRWKRSEYPEDLWTEAELWWAEQTPEVQAEARVGFERQFHADVDEVEALYASAGAENFLSGFDAIWMLLAVGSAYGIGQGGKDE